MNAQRRKTLSDLYSQLEQIKSEIEECRDEEQEYLYNMPESFQSSDKGTTTE
jgi:hypothetical protein